MGVVVQAGHDDVDEGGGEAFGQRRRDGRSNTRFYLESYEVGRYAVEGHETGHELPHKHAKSVHVAESGLGPASEQLGRRPCKSGRHPAAAGSRRHHNGGQNNDSATKVAQLKLNEQFAMIGRRGRLRAPWSCRRARAER